MANLDLMSVGQAQKEVTFNNAIKALETSFLYCIKESASAGLTLTIYGGVLLGDGVELVVEDTTLTLAPSTTNYVQANDETGVISVNQTGFTSGFIKLYQITTNAVTKTSIINKKPNPLRASSYSLPTATTTTKGGVVIGNGLEVIDTKLQPKVDGTTINFNENGALTFIGEGGGGSGGGDGGSGLTFLEEDKSILSNAILLKPNENNTESSLSVGFIKKGNGSFIVVYSAMPGDSRGNNSIDIQPYRTAVTQVSNGIYAVGIGNLLTTAKYCANIGYNNTVTNGTTSGTSGGSVVGQNSISTQLSVAFGSSCTASSANGSIAIGDNATASGAYSIATGFNVSATATGAVAMGRYSISNGQYAFVYGEGANAHSQNGGLVIGNKYSSTATSTEGTAQLRLNCYYAALQNSTLSRALTANGNATASFANQFSLNNYQRRFFRILVQMSEDKATGAEACWEIIGYIKRDNGASTTTLLSSTITPIYSSELATNNGYSVSVDANTSLGCLRITCSANAVTSSAHTIKCNATTIDNQLIISA